MTGTLQMPKYRRTTIYTGPPSERVLLVTGDINADGNDEVVIAGRIGSEGLWWLERDDAGRWQAHLMDDQYERLDAGGVLYDIDGDGRLDFLAGKGTLVEHVFDSGVGTHEAKPLRIDGKLAIAGKPYRNLDTDVPREPDADSVHLWMPK